MKDPQFVVLVSRRSLCCSEANRADAPTIWLVTPQRTTPATAFYVLADSGKLGMIASYDVSNLFDRLGIALGGVSSDVSP
jgi:hypothetical protein